MKLRVNEELTATNTDTTQNIQNEREELNIIDRARKTEMAEVTGALMVCLTTAAASLSIVQNTHSRIKEATNSGLIAIICSCICNFNYGTSFNLIRTEDSKLNSDDWLNIGARSN
jgi:hypothetical protein